MHNRLTNTTTLSSTAIPTTSMDDMQRKTVRFVGDQPIVHIIPERSQTWLDGESAELPSDYEVANAKRLAEQALASAATEEKCDALRRQQATAPGQVNDKNDVRDHDNPMAALASTGKKAKSKLMEAVRRLN